jgi:hypothetical protein
VLAIQDFFKGLILNPNRRSNVRIKNIKLSAIKVNVPVINKISYGIQIFFLTLYQI